jgi:hypothetical protein
MALPYIHYNAQTPGLLTLVPQLPHGRHNLSSEYEVSNSSDCYQIVLFNSKIMLLYIEGSTCLQEHKHRKIAVMYTLQNISAIKHKPSFSL